MNHNAFKVGDRVEVAERGGGFFGRVYGKPGTIAELRHNGQIAEVDFDDEGRDYGEVNYLRLITPAPTTSGPYMAQHNADGTLTLTPAQEAEAVEENPAPKAGQIWKFMNLNLWLITDEDKIVCLGGKSQNCGVMGVGSRATSNLGRNHTFVAHSLAEALESGKITPADLRGTP